MVSEQGDIVVVEMWYLRVWRRHKETWTDRHIRNSIGLSIVLFLGSVAVLLWANSFANEHASNPVTDIILSNTPAFDVDQLFVYGLLLLIGVVAALCIAHPKRTPFILHSLTIFMLIRSVFVSLTHIGPFPTQTAVDFGATIARFFFGGDLFFSGHTGAPFLLALIFWHNKKLRYLFLAWSVFFAVVVLLGHLHYSIDVLAAFFITYTIYHIALWLFPRERAVFLTEESQEEPYPSRL